MYARKEFKVLISFVFVLHKVLFYAWSDLHGEDSWHGVGFIINFETVTFCCLEDHLQEMG
jgi:hypothetical protein